MPTYITEELQPAGDISGKWAYVASNKNGNRLIAANGLSADKRLYTSDDTGANWTERQPAGDFSKVWGAVASDEDGSNLVAAIYDGRLYTSSDYGATWTERQPAGDVDEDWVRLKSNYDGSYLYATVNGGRIYKSDDSGATWSEIRPSGDTNYNWQCFSCNRVGNFLIAGAYGDRVFTSDDYGATWTERAPTGTAEDLYYNGADMDDTGKYIIIAMYGSPAVYTSDDYGATWTERLPVNPIPAWQYWEVGSSQDGKRLVAIANYLRAYISLDYGVTWTETQPAGDTNATWEGVAVNGEGTSILLGETSGRLYRAYTVDLADLYGIPSMACFLPLNEDEMLVLGKHQNKRTHDESLLITEFQGFYANDEYIHEDILFEN